MTSTASWVLAASIALGSGAERAIELRGDASYWVDRYGALELPAGWEERVRGVFDRVAAASGASAVRPARLVLVAGGAEPVAVAIADGSVVINRALLQVAYGELGATPAPRGDDRLALVVGHELAHVALDDLWRPAAFAADADVAQGRRVEQRADARGVLAAVMAGYDPSVVLGQGGAALLARLAPGTPATARQAVLDAELEQLVERADELRLGVRLAQLGRHEDALRLLGRFRELFPAREVLTNLGATHLAMAIEELARCDGELIARWALPVLLDPDTLAQRVRLRGGGDPHGCLTRQAVDGALRAAIEALEEAVERDPAYLPARLNLASALLVADRVLAALKEADGARQLAPDHPAANVLHAVALYRYGRDSHLVGMADEALRVLARFADDPAALFNRGAILAELGRIATAREVWQRYLERDPYGPFAAIARERLGLEATTDAPGRSQHARPAAPLVLGPLASSSIAGVERSPLLIGTFRASLLRGPSWTALAIDDVVELVEERVVPAEPSTPLVGRWGSPRARQQTAVGELLLWDGMAVDIRDGRIVARIFFRGPA